MLYSITNVLEVESNVDLKQVFYICYFGDSLEELEVVNTSTTRKLLDQFSLRNDLPATTRNIVTHLQQKMQ